MRNKFTAVIEKGGGWCIAYCAEIPGANGQGRTREEARDSLAEAIALILEDRREAAEALLHSGRFPTSLKLSAAGLIYAIGLSQYGSC